MRSLLFALAQKVSCSFVVKLHFYQLKGSAIPTAEPDLVSRVELSAIWTPLHKSLAQRSENTASVAIIKSSLGWRANSDSPLI
jgi:hypothetical protein